MIDIGTKFRYKDEQETVDFHFVVSLSKRTQKGEPAIRWNTVLKTDDEKPHWAQRPLAEFEDLIRRGYIQIISPSMKKQKSM